MSVHNFFEAMRRAIVAGFFLVLDSAQTLIVKNSSGTQKASLDDSGNATLAGTLAVTGATTHTGGTVTPSLTEAVAGAGLAINSDTIPAAGTTDWKHRARCRIFEDFFAIDTATKPPPWATQDTSAAGTPVLDYVADADNGEFQLNHDATSEAQTLTLYWADQLMIEPTKNPIFECRIKINFAGAAFTADQRIVIGLAGPRNATLDDIARHAWFRIEGANLNILAETDDGTTDDDDNDTTIDIVDNTYLTLRIDMSDLAAIKFYVNGVLGATLAAAVMTANLQPFIEIQRDAGAETEDVRIDYVMVEWDRV